MYIFYKLLNDYRHSNVKTIINSYVQNFLLPLWKKYINDITIFYDEVKKITKQDLKDNNIVNELTEEIEMYGKRIFSYIARTVDLYFLRRFLDKDYITNGIVYTGAAHSMSFIYVLNRNGFKITHCANCLNQNINQLNADVSNIINFPFEETFFDMFDLFVPANRKQCSDLSEFPLNFT
ncbi:hypothetical protein QJ856_gp0337 [Tupanvirus deep ocean]|uniref:Uncharacterized protein n=2 Tax=Tupanvirus TaxID=2094720 RepID=A0AC62A9L5_9VIRU|nr:hypothetical protein QJ856_gp0337 [Tupanvirus deep ocean]QKU34399.1 hypothetical protein [Tupanvirus deep ocean]